MTAPSTKGSTIMKPSPVKAPALKREQLDKEIETYLSGTRSALAKQQKECKAEGKAGRQDRNPRTETGGGISNTGEVERNNKIASSSSLGLKSYPVAQPGPQQQPGSRQLLRSLQTGGSLRMEA